MMSTWIRGCRSQGDALRSSTTCIMQKPLVLSMAWNIHSPSLTLPRWLSMVFVVIKVTFVDFDNINEVTAELQWVVSDVSGTDISDEVALVTHLTVGYLHVPCNVAYLNVCVIDCGPDEQLQSHQLPQCQVTFLF